MASLYGMTDTTDCAPLRTRRAAPLPPDERRAAIIHAVIPVLIEHGTHATCRQMAAAAGVAEGTIFKVFADKDELLAAAVDHVMDPASVTPALHAIDAAATFVEQLEAAATILQTHLVEIWRLVSQLQQHAPQRRPAPREGSPALTELLTRFADQLHVPPTEAATVLRGLTLSLSHPFIIETPLSPAAIVDLFLHGAGRRA
ncbi:MAG: AcrR family transcriptional regulator [Myxococcota bacterium]|jgi:AcrR family transcriptional regulator